MPEGKIPNQLNDALEQAGATIAAVFRKKVPSPVLDSFVQHVTIRNQGVLPVWQVVVGSVVPTALGFILSIVIHGSHGIPLIIGLPIGGLLLAGTLSARHKQIHGLSPAQRVEFETWDRVRYLKSCVHQGKLYSYIPGPVLEELEACARLRETILMDVQDHVHEAPALVSEIHNEVDAMMAKAIAAASSVVRSAQQSSTDVARWTADEKLMLHVVSRVRRCKDHLEAMSAVHSIGASDTSGLRQALERARHERAVAEAELEQSLLGD